MTTAERVKRTKIIINMLENGMSQSDIARLTGVSRQSINQLVHREKLNARQQVYIAVKTNKIDKPASCSNCDNTEVQAHHPNYTKPLEVIWLCESCHVLHDSKGSKHINVINSIFTGYNKKRGFAVSGKAKEAGAKGGRISKRGRATT